MANSRIALERDIVEAIENSGMIAEAVKSRLLVKNQAGAKARGTPTTRYSRNWPHQAIQRRIRDPQRA